MRAPRSVRSTAETGSITAPSRSKDWRALPIYGVDGPPALGVILACVGGFGQRPDMVLSGINHGVNVGRSALHSGTIGAVLTAAQFGIRGLAISIRFGPDPVPWRTAADLAEALVPVLEIAPPATVLNLNVPDVELGQLKGVRAARLGRGGTIRSVSYDAAEHRHSEHRYREHEKELLQKPRRVFPRPLISDDALPPGPSGTMHLDLAIPGSAGQEAPAEHDPTDVDALLIGRNFATITALAGVHEATDARDLVAQAVRGLRDAVPAP